jgi:hypothetical protein
MKTLTELIEELKTEVGEEFAEASFHPYNCKCPACRAWWLAMGKDPDTGRYGPFTEEELLGPNKEP